jgi:polyphosphate glucokinase
MSGKTSAPPGPDDALKPSIVAAMATRSPRSEAPRSEAASPRARSAQRAEKSGTTASGRKQVSRSAKTASGTARATAKARGNAAGRRSAVTTTAGTAGASTRRSRGLPRTLSFDIGGTGLKASVLSKDGELLHNPVRTPTPYPLKPEQLVYALSELAVGLPSYQRVSAGFPGMVREGHLISAPHFISPAGPGGKPTPELEKAWSDFDLQGALGEALGKPCRVANDADVQGAALIKGEGLEFVITLGTGVGTAMFWKGKLAPHVELAHHPLGKGARSYNDMLGEAALDKIGHKKWNARVAMMLSVVKALVFFDHCYIGGGNSHKVKIDLPPDVSLAQNTAGILGGIKLWERI